MYETVEMLCNKLGVVVEELIPAVAKMCITSNIVWTVIWSVLIFGCYWFCAKWIPNFKVRSEFDPYDKDIVVFVCVFIAVVVAIVCVIGFFCCLSSTVEWIVAPKAKAISYIISMVS